MLTEQIASDLTTAMKARDQVRVSTLRLLTAAMKNLQVERMHALDDDEVIEVATKQAKSRRESIEAFRGAGREDLVAKEEAELAILTAYLPAALTDAELAALVDEAIAETGASEPKQMGSVMKVLIPKVRGRADGNVISALVKSRLGA